MLHVNTRRTEKVPFEHIYLLFQFPVPTTPAGRRPAAAYTQSYSMQVPMQLSVKEGWARLWWWW
jgi:hypothetical protein